METVTDRGQIRNPYSKENRAKYVIGPVETALRAIGFRTGYDNYMMDQDNLEAQWDSQNQSLSYEENYNSAAAAAARMREAGINPDLQGIEGAGEAAEMAENELPPTQGSTDLEYLQKIGSFAANLGQTLIDITTGGASIADKIGKLKIAKEQWEQNKDIEENIKLREMAFDALKDYGSDEEFENGAYIAKQKGLSGKRYEKFSRYYDELWRGIQGQITRDNIETESINSAYEADTAQIKNNIKTKMYEAENKAAEIINEKRKREIEFLEKHPEYNPAETEAKIQIGDQLAKQYKAIELEAEARLTKLNSDTIEAYEDEMLLNTRYAGINYEGMTEKQIKETNRRHWSAYRRARKRIGAKGTSLTIAGNGFND